VGADVAEPPAAAIMLVGVLHALSDPTRLAVVAQLERQGETLCGRLEVSVAKSTLSQHLRVLREAGVTRTRPAGTQRWLSVRRDDLDALFPGLLDVVLAAVRTEAARSPFGDAPHGAPDGPDGRVDVGADGPAGVAPVGVPG
jgi:DNA-binding transcriptional ArsR family regulator